MIETHVGFTGTKEGLTSAQAGSLFRASAALTKLVSSRLVLHHGDCVGADASMHDIATELGWYRIIHPPIKTRYQAFKRGDESRKPDEYLVRNKHIVNASFVMFSCPKAMYEEQRGGTWHATRYARSKGKRIYIFWPDGSVTMEERK